MPSLRDSNPLLDHDLSLIITTFELGMLKSNEEESCIAVFRGDLVDTIELPKSILSTANSIPVKDATETATQTSVSRQPITSSASTVSSGTGLVSENSPSGEENANIFGYELPYTVDEEWKKKVLETINECVPCDLRLISKFDTKILNDKALNTWKMAVKGLKDIIKDFKKKIKDNTNVFSDFCSLGKQLKFHCLPDLEKISWLLNFVLGQMMRKFSVELNFFDKFVISILGPVFNEMMSMFSIVKEAAVEPLKCITDSLSLVTKLPEEFSLHYGATATATVSRMSRILSAQRLRETQAAINRNQEMLLGSQNFRKFRDKLDKVSELVSMEKLQGYLTFGTRWIEDKVSWFNDLFQEVLDRSFSGWNDKMSANSSKLEILRLIKIIGAVMKAGKDGKLDCGTMSDPITEDDLRNITTNMNQNTPLEIVIEEGNIVLRRNATADTNVQNQGDSPARSRLEQEILASGNVPRIQTPPNVVLSKPLDSCLKKVTEEQASQVRLWIRQLEEEMAV